MLVDSTQTITPGDYSPAATLPPASSTPSATSLPQSASPDDGTWHKFGVDLKALLEACGTNKNDRAIVGITACIGAAVRTKRDIVRMLSWAGLNWRHVGIILRSGTGPNPAQDRWLLDDAGRYKMHDS